MFYVFDSFGACGGNVLDASLRARVHSQLYLTRLSFGREGDTDNRPSRQRAHRPTFGLGADNLLRL